MIRALGKRLQAIGSRLAGKSPLAKRGYTVTNYNNLNHKQHARGRVETFGQLYSRDARKAVRLCRDSYINDAPVLRMVDYRVNRVVGRSGPKPQVNTGSRQLDNRIESAWRVFTRTLGDTQMGWTDFCRIAQTEKLVAGESFIVRSFGRGGTVGFQIFETEQLDHSADFSVAGAGEHVARGIVYNNLNRPVRYLFRRAYPGTRGYTSAYGENAVDVNASSVCHYFDRYRPTQYRGISKLATIIENVYLVGDIDNAELQGKRKEAYYSVYLKTAGDANGMLDGLGDIDELGLSTNPNPTREFDMTPGVMNSGDFDLLTVDPKRPGSSYIEFTGNILKRNAAAFAVPYSAATGDTSASSYSTERAASMHCKPIWDADRKAFADNVCRFVFESWLMAESMRPNNTLGLGSRSVTDIANSVTWQFDGYEWVDPKAEAVAIREKLELGLISHSDACMQVGTDADTQRTVIANEIDDFAALGYMPTYMQEYLQASEPTPAENNEDFLND